MINRETAADGYLPLKALASYSGLSVRTLRAIWSTRDAPLPHYRIGGKILVKRSEFDLWAATFRTVETDRVFALVGDVLQAL